MSAKKVSFVTALLCLTAAAMAQSPLPSGKAPFRPDASASQTYEGDAVFDSAKLTYRYGSKKIIFREDGTFSIFSGGRQLAKAYIFIATPHQYWQTNEGGKKSAGEYAGKRMQVRDVKTEGGSLIFEGLLPWNRKGEPLLAAPWKLTVIPEGKGRFKISCEYTVPEGKKRIDDGMFMNLSNLRNVDAGTIGNWNPKSSKSIGSYQRTTLNLEGNLAADNFRIESGSWVIRKSLRFGFFKSKCVISVDLGKSQVESPDRKPGGVDLLAADALTVPERESRNLLPNPYFAAGAHFLTPYGIDDGSKFSSDAKFGRYSLDSQGWYRIATVPADAGDYVFSFYGKGNGHLGLVFRSAGGAGRRFEKTVVKSIRSARDWTRYEVRFSFPKDNGLVIELRMPKGIKLDGLQLEKGSRATAFEAPKVESRTLGDFFFESGKKIDLKFELSTLEKEISGRGGISIRNFFGEKVFQQEFEYRLGAGKYGQLAFDPGKLPDGIYVIRLDYGRTAPAQFFRFAVMPFLKNTHPTARVFSLGYFGHQPLTSQISDRFLARLQAIGIGTNGHANQMTGEVMEKYAKYRVIPFDIGFASRCGSEKMGKLFPDLKDIPAGRTWFYVARAECASWTVKGKGLLPDYRLLGGWNAEYRKNFQEKITRQVRRYPKRAAYRFASEWPRDIKDDPHYIDLYAAFREAVKSVYPDALVYEAGDCNMDISGGTAAYDQLLTRMDGKTITDFAATHTYVKDIRQLYPNFRAFVEMLKKHPGYEKCRLAFPEGMHFYPYNLPAWDMEQVCWMGEGWRGTSLSYDLGWSEKISAAYFARAWLVYLTEFDRVWCGTASASNSGNFFMDDDLTPRAFQKIPNTLGVLLGNPRRYLGDFTFAPDTKCLVWEDGLGRPIAAVWNEDPAVNSGYKDAPPAKMDYPGAEYIDLMGVKRKPAPDGQFPVTPFPLFIRGKAGDCAGFVKAISGAVLADPDKLPCRIGFELKSAESLKLTLINPLARELTGTLNIFNREFDLTIPKTGEQHIDIQLPRPIRKGRLEKLTVPYRCVIDGHTIKQNLELNCFIVPKFHGDWKKIPAIPLTNKVAADKSFTAKDFSASYQLAWDEKKMYLRTVVKDDVFAPGSRPGYRWNYDVLQVYFDTRCSAMKTGKRAYDDDDYEYGFMPAADGRGCEVWRALSPDIQLTLGIAAPKNNSPAPEIPARFTRTADGYIYEAEFPADYLLPIKLSAGYNFAFGIYAADKDRGKGADKALSNTTEPGKGCYNKPHLWPIALLAE